MHIALLYNLKPDNAADHGDLYAEFDSPKTLEALTKGITAHGHTVDCIPFDVDLVPTFGSLKGDLIFSIAENLGGVSREAWVPALCDMYQRPYVFSGVLANTLTLDKALTKRVLLAEGLPVAPDQIFRNGREPLSETFADRFPLFVKPLHEGSGKGISTASRVHDEAQLRKQLATLLKTYKQPVLAEPYLDGREFTIGVVGNDNPKVFMMELDFARLPDNHKFYTHHIKDEDPEAPIFTAPPDLTEELEVRLRDIALGIKQLCDLKDCFRFDVRCDRAGNPYVLEINPLPGLTPNYSDLPRMCEFYGVRHVDLIGMILDAARKRWGL
ncbi:MAG: hypothetical protein ABI743_14315 [bacterium]